MRAVQRFQKKYGIFSQNDKGYGIVERKTKKKIREIFANDPDYLRKFDLLQEKPSKRKRPIKIKSEERHFSWHKKIDFCLCLICGDVIFLRLPNVLKSQIKAFITGIRQILSLQPR